ncbi:MAG: M56 family metallopeptidase [Gemmatimonadota bacterium]
MSGEILLSWLATYALHSTLLIGAAWVATRRGPLAASTARDAIWKIATTGALLTATLQVAAPFGRVGIELNVPRDTSVVATPEPGRSSADRVVAAERMTVAHLVPPSIPSGDFGIVVREIEGVGPGAPPLTALADRSSAKATGSGGMAAITLPGWRWAALVLWLALGAALLLRHAVRRRRFARRLGRRREITGGPAREALDELLQKANAGRRVSLTATGAVTSPVALHGNEICVPDRALGELDRGALRALLAHELAHLERRDPLWIEIAATLESLLFFQPLHRIGRRELRSAAEEECDAWAARLTGERHALARCLVEVAGWMRSVRMAEAAGMAEPGKGLERRVERLIGPNPSSARGSWRAGALSALGLVAAIACGGPAVRPAEGDPAPTQPEAVARPDRASPPSLVAARPVAPSTDAAQAPPVATKASPPDTLERSDRVREYVFREDDEEPWFAFDWSPGALHEEMERLGETLGRSLEPLEDFEFQFESDFLKDFEFHLETPGTWWDSPHDTLRLRALGNLGAAWAAFLPGQGLRIRIEGEVEWGDGTISSISPGGRVEIHDRRQSPERKLVVEPGPEGELGFDYEVDGRPHGFDAAGREWLEGMIERIRKADESGEGIRLAPDWAPEALAEFQVHRLEERVVERQAELEEQLSGQRATALRARLRALEAEMDRLRQEIERLETDRSDS